MLRTTLKNIETQLAPFDYIVRCHKSYIIRLREELNLVGNAKGKFFESPDFSLRIPVSRSKHEVVSQLLAEVKNGE